MKKKKFLIIYFIIVVLLLVVIMFVLPDSFIKKTSKYKNFYKDETENKETVKKEPFLDYEKQISNLEKNVYSYEYEIDYNGVLYVCQGNKKGEKEEGSCTKPKKVSYTEKNYNDVFKNINKKFLDVNYIFEQLKDIEPEETDLGKERMFTYNLEESDTEVIINTDKKNITRICIARGYLTYVLKYSNIGI